MTTERDTHFFGFAKLLVTELAKNGFVTPVYGARPYTLIAQRAYDLVEHTLDNAPGDHRASLEDIPDLTEWPAEPEA